MNENEFILGGKTFVAVESSMCKGCAFENEACPSLKIPSCIYSEREDRRSVIFVEKNKIQATKVKTKLVASWIVYVSKGKNPFRVMRLGTARRICTRREGELVEYAWHFSTRKKARDFAWQMNAAMHYALD